MVVGSLAMSRLDSFFSASKVDIEAMAKALDAMSERERIDAAMTLNAKQQARLFDAAQGFKKISIDDFVPTSKGELSPVIHYGRNSLPGCGATTSRRSRASRAQATSSRTTSTRAR